MEQKLQRRLTFILFHELEYLFWFWIAEEMQSESPEGKKKLSQDAFLESFIAKSYRVFSTH